MKLLLVEDDVILSDALTAQLGSAGYHVDHAPNGAVADYLSQQQSYDIAVLDLGLPMLDGWEVLQRLRQRQPNLPVLILSARDALKDRVHGLQAGADDYVTKPFDSEELLARLQVLLRRRQPTLQAAAATINQVAQLRIERDQRRLWVRGVPVELSGREWTLLMLLFDYRDKVVHKDMIHRAWGAEGNESGGGNMIEVYIHRLRRKLEGSGVLIRTVRGLGYLMEAANHQ